MYTPDGYYVGAAHAPRPAPFASGDWFRGSNEEFKEEALGYIAYSGPFHTDEEKQTLTHSMFVSLFPNWLGQTQPRVVKIEGDMLHLSGDADHVWRKENNVLSVLEAGRVHRLVMASAIAIWSMPARQPRPIERAGRYRYRTCVGMKCT